MDRKYIILIVAIIAVLAAIGAFFLFSNPMTLEHSAMVLSDSSYMEVPVDPSAVSKADKEGVFYYIDKNNGINITSSSNITSDAGLKEFNSLKNGVMIGSKKMVEENAVIFAKNGIYSILVNNGKYNDTVLIQSTNKNLLMQCYNSLKFHSPTDSLKIDDTGSKSVVNATQTTQKAVKSNPSYTPSSKSVSSSSSSSSSSSGRSIEDDFGPATSTKSYKSSGSSYKSSSSGGSSKKSSGSIEDDF